MWSIFFVELIYVGQVRIMWRTVQVLYQHFLEGLNEKADTEKERGGGHSGL